MPVVWRLRHRGPCLRRPPRRRKPCLWRLRFAIGGLASGGPLASSGCLVRWLRFRPGHAQGGASREKASITPRIAEGAQLRDNITSGANNDNSTGDNPPPPLGPPPGEECCRLVNYHVRFVVEMFVNRMMFIDMFVNGSASINWRGIIRKARSGCCEPRSKRFWRASVCGTSYHLSLGGDSSAQLS